MIDRHHDPTLRTTVVCGALALDVGAGDGAAVAIVKRPPIRAMLLVDSTN